tara:strand:+ start:241 stop:438 length:198 start_codon:yes stop_codon:yes gene_type:complete
LITTLLSIAIGIQCCRTIALGGFAFIARDVLTEKGRAAFEIVKFWLAIEIVMTALLIWITVLTSN